MSPTNLEGRIGKACKLTQNLQLQKMTSWGSPERRTTQHQQRGRQKKKELVFLPSARNACNSICDPCSIKFRPITVLSLYRGRVECESMSQ